MALAAAIVRGTAALPAIHSDRRAGAKGDAMKGGILDTGSDSARPRTQAEVNSGQRIRRDGLRDGEEAVMARAIDTFSEGSSDGVGGGVAGGGQIGMGNSAGASAGSAAGAFAEGRAGAEDATAKLVRGGPGEDPDRARPILGSVTEVLTPEQNAALLKVRSCGISGTSSCQQSSSALQTQLIHGHS